MAKDPLSFDGYQYKFDFRPNKPGEKSRLELSTCFVKKTDFESLDMDPSRLRRELPSMLQHLCPVVNMPIEAVHTYQYQVKINRDDFPSMGSYIMAQWHGTSDGKIVRDDLGCVARISDDDLVSLCDDGFCTKGVIYNEREEPTGLRYEQGGYPPLSFHFKDGTFYVLARSDDREFIAKSGCHPGSFHRRPFYCPLHPRQQFHVIWEKNIDDFPFNRWNTMTWKIKWSEYGNDPSLYQDDTDGGVLISNAWIRLWINDKLEIDWKGPCGRNDDGRVPYFKMGIYNPSGSMENLLFRTRGYHYSYSMLNQPEEIEDRKQVESLKVHQGGFNDTVRNLNELKHGLEFGNITPDPKAMTCTLQAESGNLATIASVKYTRLKNNKQIRTVLKAMADVILEQQERLKHLEMKFKEPDDKVMIDLSKELEYDDY